MNEDGLRKVLGEVVNGKGGWAHQIEIAVKKLLPLITNKEPVATVLCSDGAIKPCPNCRNEAKHYPDSNSQANAIYCNECPLGVESAGMSDAALFMVWNNLPRAI